MKKIMNKKFLYTLMIMGLGLSFTSWAAGHEGEQPISRTNRLKNTLTHIKQEMPDLQASCVELEARIAGLEQRNLSLEPSNHPDIRPHQGPTNRNEKWWHSVFQDDFDVTNPSSANGQAKDGLKQKYATNLINFLGKEIDQLTENHRGPGVLNAFEDPNDEGMGVPQMDI